MLGLSLKVLGRSLKAMIGAALAALALAVISGLLVIGYLYVSKSDYFAVKKVIISGLNNISREEILEITGLNRPVNIWLFDADQAAAALSTLSWLDEARVSKTMPDRVTIEIVEHRPKLLVSLGRLYFLDDKGILFKELEPWENPDLAIVSGFTEDELLSRTPGVETALAEVFSLVEVLAARQDIFKLDHISEINYDAVRGLTIFARRGELEVKVGFGSYEEKFRRLNRVEAHLKQHGQFEDVAYINLEASPRVIVRPG
jgi:cell division septal protein FtsQ